MLLYKQYIPDKGSNQYVSGIQYNARVPNPLMHRDKAIQFLRHSQESDSLYCQDTEFEDRIYYST